MGTWEFSHDGLGNGLLEWGQTLGSVGTVSGEDDWNPRYNVAPTQPVPVIRQNLKEH
jgi:hypothetical protein